MLTGSEVNPFDSQEAKPYVFCWTYYLPPIFDLRPLFFTRFASMAVTCYLGRCIGGDDADADSLIGIKTTQRSKL